MSMNMTQTLTVAELREWLSAYDDDMPVLIGSAAGDYWNTMVAKPVHGGEELLVEWSTYHDSYSVPDQGDDKNCEWALVIGA